ncbi:MAG TPA: TIGR02679 domain-containing protein, partial [Longimicrobium sp.]
MDADLKADLLAILGKPGFAPLLARLHDALARHGEPKGRVEVATYEEADALGDLIPLTARPGKKVSVAEIDQLLRERTIFHCSLEEAIVLHRNAPIVRPREVRERTLAARERAVRRCFEVLPSLGLSPAAYGEIVGWLHASENQLRAGFTRWGADKLLDAVCSVARAFGRMPGKDGPPVFLAELANEVAGGAHGLDSGRPAGTLLFR